MKPVRKYILIYVASTWTSDNVWSPWYVLKIHCGLYALSTCIRPHLNLSYNQGVQPRTKWKQEKVRWPALH
ncbi:unnamed protein product [Allacma fusca]|uniref:Uncharacterized protein n=1 Tax=Allacma fusca TaxID=39272 RepID=A0A8J2PE84_9HEXA|nr:unnamed protein product [Allacma fusca]